MKNLLIVTRWFLLIFGLVVSSSTFGFNSGLIDNITQRAYSQAEQAITINRANPNNIFIATNGRGGFGDQTYLVFAQSVDGGHTWLRGTFADGSDGLPAACCDPSLTSDRFGNLYIAYLASNTLTPDQSLEVIVGRSVDGGRHWTLLANLGPGDEPTIIAGPGKNPNEQSLWVTWTNDGTGQLLAAGITVMGRGLLKGAFSPPQEVLQSTTVEGYGDIAIGPHGKVVVAHQSIDCVEGPDAIRVNTNLLGIGGEFGSTVTAMPSDSDSIIIGACRHIPAQPNRSVDAEIGLAWNPTTNRLFMVYTSETSDSFGNSQDINNSGIYDTNIELIYSDDDGVTWSSPRRINDDTTYRSQFLPKIAMDPMTGNLAITWYDARNDDGSGTDGQRDRIANDEAELWGTVSLDGGQSFMPNFKISARLSSAPLAGTVSFPDDAGFDYGDYIGLDFFNWIIRPVWADNSNSTHDNPDVPSFDAYTCQLSLSPLSSPFSAHKAGDICSKRSHLNDHGLSPIKAP